MKQENSSEDQPKLRQRDWFALGGRHGLDNRVSDLSLILPHFGDLAQHTAVDIGAAEGDISFWLAERYREVHAVEAMDQVYGKLAERVSQVPTITCEKADIRSWDCRASYDHVFFLGVLHYFHDDEVKARALEKCLGMTRSICFVRSGIREQKQKQKHGRNLDRLAFFTPIELLRSAAVRFGFTAALIDNAAGRTDENRLGDLVVFRRNSSSAPDLEILLQSVDPGRIIPLT